MITKKERRIKIKHRIRKKVNGTASRPRLTVFRSNKAIYAQVVNDLEGKTLVFAGSKGITEGTKTEVAKKVGQAVAASLRLFSIAMVISITAAYRPWQKVPAKVVSNSNK